MTAHPAYHFYSTARLCPNCGGQLLTTTPVNRTTLQGLLQRLGTTCYCMACNRRYRATSRLSYPLVGWLGPVGRWIWWKTTSLELTLEPGFEP